MPSDFRNIKDSGKACIGCGRGPDVVILMRLRTYSRSLCCRACFLKYAKCENVNPVVVKCHHDPVDHLKKTGMCTIPGCGCPSWIHGLENEFDRQYAESVGKMSTSKECNGYGINLGKCGRLIFLDADGALPRLCGDCQARWIQETREGQREIKALLDLDMSKPN